MKAFDQYKERLEQAGGRTTGSDFIGPDGQLHVRDWHGARVKLIDLDYMTAEQLEAFIARHTSTRVERGPRPIHHTMFPGRPIGAPRAARTMITLARLRLEILQNERCRRSKELHFNRLYRTLPVWAQWRKELNPLATLPPGKPPRRRPSTALPILRLLKNS